MKKVIINKTDGTHFNFYIDKETENHIISKYKKLHKYINEKIIKLENVKNIKIRLYNEHTKKHYLCTTFDKRFEYFYNNKQRIEFTYKWNEKGRCYVGKSTGWIPIYLEIKRCDSIGGGSLLVSSIKEIKPLNKYAF